MAAPARQAALRGTGPGQPPATDSEHGELLPPEGANPVRAACGKTARAVRKGGRRQRHATATSPDPTPAKPPNNPGPPGAEVVEGRGLPEGNMAGDTRP